MKFHYFEVYGKGESIRMTLHKAGVAFENLQHKGDEWKEFKASGVLRFGQMPMLELDDGTQMYQTTAIINYLGEKHGLVPADAMKKYQGQMLCEHFWNDVLQKLMKGIFMPDGEEKDKALKESFEVHFPAYLK